MSRFARGWQNPPGRVFDCDSSRTGLHSRTGVASLKTASGPQAS